MHQDGYRHEVTLTEPVNEAIELDPLEEPSIDGP
jgi:hypothetical protein